MKDDLVVIFSMILLTGVASIFSSVCHTRALCIASILKGTTGGLKNNHCTLFKNKQILGPVCDCSPLRPLMAAKNHLPPIS